MAEQSPYFVFRIPEADRGQRFYAALFGWRFAPGSAPDSLQIEGLMGGILSYAGEPEIKLYFDVENIDSMVARVRELGGSCNEIEETPSGLQVDCRDDQGTPFSLHQGRSST